MSHSEILLLLLGLFTSPFLNNGISIDSVHPSGNIPLSNKVLKKFTKKSSTWLPEYLIISSYLT